MSRLIVVDDNELDRLIIKYSLIKYPIFDEVQYYDEGLPLINYLIAHRDKVSQLPDAIFLDLRMPGYDGWDVLNALKELYPSLNKDIAVYIVTASISSHDKFRALNYSFVHKFISKPLTKEILAAISNEFYNQSA